MEAKLKSLKVVDLKDILSKADVSAPAKANKQDLIAKILASPAAVDAFNARENATKPAAPVPDEADILAPPEEIDWNAPDAEPAPAPNPPPAAKPASVAKPTPATKPASAAKPAPVKSAPDATKPAASATATIASSTAVKPAADASAETDAELEKRKARAARFGIPLVEPKARPAPARNASSNKDAKAAPTAAPAEDTEKLKARAARFGVSTPTTPVAGQKRAAPEDKVDAEEAERRRKRAERFGTAVKA